MDDEDVLEQEREHVRAEMLLKRKKIIQKEVIIETQKPIFIAVPQQENDPLHQRGPRTLGPRHNPIYFYTKRNRFQKLWIKLIDLFK